MVDKLFGQFINNRYSNNTEVASISIKWTIPPPLQSDIHAPTYLCSILINFVYIPVDPMWGWLLVSDDTWKVTWQRSVWQRVENSILLFKKPSDTLVIRRVYPESEFHQIRTQSEVPLTGSYVAVTKGITL